MTFVQITDPHLSDCPNTATWQAFNWALEQTNRLQPDILLITGDITTYGNAKAATKVCDMLTESSIPVFFTPGNAEHRGNGVGAALNHFTKQKHVINNQLFLFPDTSHGKIDSAGKEVLNQAIETHRHLKTRIIATHYPTDALDTDSQKWLENFIHTHKIQLLVAGHKHIHRTRQIGPCTEIITRGLDPDKAIGDLPGISQFENTPTGGWTETFIPWNFQVSLQPCSPATIPVGWSIQGDPIAATNETRTSALSCLELRPKDLAFSNRDLYQALMHLRAEQDLYLSWHLPNLSWDSEKIQGIDTLKEHLACACDMGVNHLTVHVPQAPALAMQAPDLWQQFEDLYIDLFQDAVRSGIRLAIENVHNASGVQPTDIACKFATDIPSYIRWIKAIRTRLDNAPNVGAHFDIGHARNNGEYSNMQPTSEWYARVGQYILGYHIHQIGAHPETGKTINHIEMHTLFDRRISYAGFCYAWSTRQINRAPLFVEIRDHEQRRRSTHRLKKLFEQSAQISTSLDLPCHS